MTDVLRIAHHVANPEVGTPEIHSNTSLNKLSLFNKFLTHLAGPFVSNRILRIFLLYPSLNEIHSTISAQHRIALHMEAMQCKDPPGWMSCPTHSGDSGQDPQDWKEGQRLERLYFVFHFLDEIKMCIF